jgi:mono/diheme cytochrome c family protein
MSKRISWSLKKIGGCLLIAVITAGTSWAADPATHVEKTGAQLFYSLCASCHGAQAHGDGPVAPLLVTPPPDLTRITQRHNGDFPAEDIRRAIDGRSPRLVHGSRNMPVWGHELYFSDRPDDAAAHAHADAAIKSLVEYIRSLQK